MLTAFLKAVTSNKERTTTRTLIAVQDNIVLAIYAIQDFIGTKQ
jgi:hypothetical protein